MIFRRTAAVGLGRCGVRYPAAAAAVAHLGGGCSASASTMMMSSQNIFMFSRRCCASESTTTATTAEAEASDKAAETTASSKDAEEVEKEEKKRADLQENKEKIKDIASTFRARERRHDVHHVGPPGFDIRRLSDESVKNAGSLRVQFENDSVILIYFPQFRVQGITFDEKTHSEERIRLVLPTTFIARFLSVIEGRIDKCEIATRGTQGSFSKSDGATFIIKCSTFTGSGNFEWNCTFTAGETAIFRRFLKRCLHSNLGFRL